MSESTAKLSLWEKFCASHRIAETAVPLFAEDGGIVRTTHWGRDQREVLVRSTEMERKILEAAAELTLAHAESPILAEGILYMMLWRECQQVLPLYIGKAGRVGRKGGISANLRKLESGKSKF